MSAKTTTAQLAIKLPQTVEEVTEGTTPPTSPTFASCGPVESISINKDGTFIDVAQIGPEDLISIISGLKKYELKMKYNFLAPTFTKYAVNAANYGTPAGTISASLTILWSFYLNGAENFIFAKGARAKDCSIVMEAGKITSADVTFVCMKIVSQATHGLTTPVFASVPTGTVYAHLDGGPNPVSWKGAAVNARRVTVTMGRNTAPDYTLGNADPYGTQPHGRRVSVEVMALWTAPANEADFDAGTIGTLTVTLKTTTATLTFANAVVKSYKRDSNATASEAIGELMQFGCPTVVLA